MFAAIAATSFWASMPARERGLVASEYVHDFGDVRQQAVLTHEFTLSNNSSRKIDVLDVHANCDCSKHTLSSQHISPSGSARLFAEWEIRSRRGRTATRLIAEYIGEDRRKNILTFQLAANVIADYDLDPDVVTVESSHDAVRIVKLTPRAQSGVNVLAASCGLKAIRTRILPDKRAVELAFDAAVWAKDPPPTISGRYETRVMIETDSVGEPVHRLDVTIVSTGSS